MDDSNNKYYVEDDENNQDELDPIDPIEEGVAEVIPQEKKVNNKEEKEDVTLYKRYNTKERNKYVSKKELLKNDIKEGVSFEKESDLPEGMAIEQVYEKFTIKLSLHEADWKRMYNMIRSRREKIKDYFQTAAIRYTQELEMIDKIRKEQIIHYTQEDVRLQVEAELEKKIMLKKALWEPRFGRRSEKEGPKTPMDVISDLDKELGTRENLDEVDREEKDKMVDRLKKKSLWQPRYTKKPKALPKGVGVPIDEELEAEVDRLSNTDNSNDSNTEEENFAASIKTEGVLPQEKGMPEDTGADDAPTQEEMAA